MKINTDTGEATFIADTGIVAADLATVITPINSLYNFQFDYANGDSYTGTGYASSDKGYHKGDTFTVNDEHCQAGKYTITNLVYDSTVNPDKVGQVFVSSYFDAESNRTFTPLNNSNPLGYSYLGSECGYIIKDGVEDFKFGKGYWESDLAARYTYKFIYNDGKGDYYTGAVYASQDYGYSVGQTFSTSCKG